MKVLIVGLGVIGSTYGYVFNEAGIETQHLIRENSKNEGIEELKISMLDGRTDPKGISKNGVYPVIKAQKGNSYDFIFVSVPHGKIADALETLRANNVNGTVILACGIWESHDELAKIMHGFDYILGYPVAGGNKIGNELTCCLFDHFMLESREKAKISNYDDLLKLFADCSLKTEIPFDMLEWIWLHMAINAGVIATAGKYGNIENTSEAAEKLMDSSKGLSEAVMSIRETTNIIASRNVNLKNYNNELFAYKFPHRLAGIIMKKMFASNVLSRKIMTLHNNANDLLFVCENVYELGKDNNIKAPVFYADFDSVKAQVKSHIEK